MSQRSSRATTPADAVGRGADLSIVVPFFNEEESVVWVLEEIVRLYPDAEVLAVDDGSRDDTWFRMREIDGVVALRLGSNRGQSAALWVGLQRATRAICVLMDGDGQNDPEDIGRLVAALEQADVACGYRRDRQDSVGKKVASRLANAIRGRVLDDGIRDTGCALKAFSREQVACLIPFDGLHRFLPALFKGAGLRLVEVGVSHRPRRFGVSKYGNLSRAVRGLYDLFGVRWFLRRRLAIPRIETRE